MTDFTLDVRLSGTGQPHEYRAEAPGAATTFTYRDDLLSVRQRLQALEAGATLGGGPEVRAEVETFGRDLYGRLFSGDLGAHWADLRAAAGGQPVRLRLRVADDAPVLQALPWEFLHDGAGFLVAGRQVFLTRGAADLPDLPAPAAESGPLNVLCIVSHPLNLPDEARFEPDEELAVIYEALDAPLRRGQIDLDVVDETSVTEMQRVLVARDYHVVHFIGHGNFDESHGGYLVIEDESGDATPLPGDRFAALVGGRQVRLVLLSACRAAKASPRAAYLSVAGALLRRGLPAAVAMQYSIRNDSARTFYRTVYQALAANRPLDQAVAEGQQALYLDGGDRQLDWATPVLFTRGAGDWRLGIDAGVTRGAQPGLLQPDAAPAPLGGLGGLEDVGRGFVGRQREQRAIRRAFLQETARAALIHGFGGIGKTILATRVARRLAETERFDGAFGLTVRADLKPEEVLRALNGFLKRCGVDALDAVVLSPAPLPQKIDALVGLLRQMRLVLIFDNCESWLTAVDGRHVVADPEVADLLARLTAGLDRGSKLILTSRYTFDLLPPGRGTGAVLPVPLGEWSPGEAIRRMGALPGLRNADYATRARVYRLIGGHPYVLNLFAERAARSGVDLVLNDVTVADVRREADELGRFFLARIVDDLSASARRLLVRLGALRREEAPRPALEALSGTTRIDVEIDELVGWGLLSPARYDDNLCDDPEMRYRLHALVRERAAARLGEGKERKDALLALAGFYSDEVRLEAVKYSDVRVFNRLEARHYYFAAGEYDRAGEIDSNMTEHLVRWGLLDTARAINRETAEHASGKVRAAALHHWGIVEQERGNYAEATRCYEQSLEIERELGNKSGIASTLDQLGVLHSLQGNVKEAIGYHERSLELRQELGDKHGVAITLHNLGNIHQDQGDYGEAARLYEQSLEIRRELRDKSGIADSLHQLGMIHQAQGDYGEAIRLYEQSLAIARELGDKRGIAQSLGQLGAIHQLQGDYGEAARLYEQSLEIERELGDKSGIATSLHQLGMIHQAQGDYGEAARCYKQSLQIERELGDKSGIAASLHNLGAIHQLQGDYGEAARLYEQSLAIARELGDKSGIAASLHQLGMIHQDQGEYGEAARCYEQSLEIRRKLGDKRGIATSLHNMGNIHYVQGDYDEAARLYEQSLQTFQELGAKSEQAAVLHQLGMIHQLQGDYDEAARGYEQSLAIARELGDKSGIATSLHQLGTIHQAQGDYDEAARLYEQSLEIERELGDKSGIAASLGQMGSLAQEQGDLKGALVGYARALARFRELHAPDAQLVERWLSRLKAQVGEAQFAAWWAECAAQYPEMQALSPADIPAEEEGAFTDEFAREVNEACNVVVQALRAGNAAQIAQAGQQVTALREKYADVEGAAPFLAVLQAMLAGEDHAALAAGLTGPFREIYATIVKMIAEESAAPDDRQAQLVGQIVTDTVGVMTRGDRVQRGQHRERLRGLCGQAAAHPELKPFAAFLDAVIRLLESGKPPRVDLEPPFDAAWREICEKVGRR